MHRARNTVLLSIALTTALGMAGYSGISRKSRIPGGATAATTSYSPDGSRVVSAWQDAAHNVYLRVIDAHSGQLLAEHKLKDQGVSVSYAPSGGKSFLLGQYLFDTMSGRQLASVWAERARPNSLTGKPATAVRP